MKKWGCVLYINTETSERNPLQLPQGDHPTSAWLLGVDSQLRAHTVHPIKMGSCGPYCHLAAPASHYVWLWMRTLGTHARQWVSVWFCYGPQNRNQFIKSCFENK